MKLFEYKDWIYFTYLIGNVRTERKYINEKHLILIIWKEILLRFYFNVKKQFHFFLYRKNRCIWYSLNIANVSFLFQLFLFFLSEIRQEKNVRMRTITSVARQSCHFCLVVYWWERLRSQKRVSERMIVQMCFSRDLFGEITI